MHMHLEGLLADHRSEFQRARVVKTRPFGKILVLDTQTQSASFDEKTYHESLVQPAMLLHPNPQHVFIGGGGEFATAREVLKHRSVEKCVMVDIDEAVCNMCREHLPEWGDGVFEDSRLEVHYEDAKGFLEADPRKYDVIIMDIADPVEAGPG
jgi:thermospermine synthase